jgi:hypothetical protein
MDKNKENKILVLLVIIALIINFVNYIFYYNIINPFYEIWSFLAFLAGTLGITIFPLGIAAFISVFFVLSKKHKHKYRYYLAIFFLILSLFSLYVSYANSKYGCEAQEVSSDAKLTKLTEIEIDGFIRYISKKDSFIVLFPEEPEISEYKIEGSGILKNYQSFVRNKAIEYNVFIIEPNSKILSNKAISAFLNSIVKSQAGSVKDGIIISEKSTEFQGFEARGYIYSNIVLDTKMIHKGVIFIVDGDPIQLSVLYPEKINESEVNYKEFVNSFQLIPLELELSDQKYTNDKYKLSFYPPAGWEQRDLLSRKYNKIAIFANEAGHSIEIYESVSPCKEVKNEFLQSDIDKEGNMKKTFALPESNTGMTILVRCIEKSGKTFIIKGVAPEKTFFRSESIFKKSLKTFSFE